MDACCTDSGSRPSGEHRRFVTAIAIDAVGSGVFMPVSMLYFLVATPLTPGAGRRRDLDRLGRSRCPAGPVIGARRRPGRRQAGAAGRQRAAGRSASSAYLVRRLASPACCSGPSSSRVGRTRSGAPTATSSRPSRGRGSGSSGSASSARCATSASRSAGWSPGWRSRSAPTTAYAAVVVANARVVRRRLRAAARGARHRGPARRRRRPAPRGRGATVLRDRPLPAAGARPGRRSRCR